MNCFRQISGGSGPLFWLLHEIRKDFLKGAEGQNDGNISNVIDFIITGILFKMLRLNFRSEKSNWVLRFHGKISHRILRKNKVHIVSYQVTGRCYKAFFKSLVNMAFTVMLLKSSDKRGFRDLSMVSQGPF